MHTSSRIISASLRKGCHQINARYYGPACSAGKPTAKVADHSMCTMHGDQLVDRQLPRCFARRTVERENPAPEATKSRRKHLISRARKRHCSGPIRQSEPLIITDPARGRGITHQVIPPSPCVECQMHRKPAHSNLIPRRSHSRQNDTVAWPIGHEDTIDTAPEGACRQESQLQAGLTWRSRLEP
jgi:hypothetical protein